MPNRKKADLIIHPLRLQIFQVLANQSLTTSEISQALPWIPQASLYRHLRMLLDNNMIEVQETRVVRGVQEKVYQLARPYHLNAQDVQNFTKEEQFNFFTIYAASLLKDFHDYLATSPPDLDYLADQAGFTETTFFANDQEMEKFRSALIQALNELKRYHPASDRRLRKLAIVSHPVSGKETEK
jgi:DNA-binding transcriptional ArsR family regulator